MGCKTRTANNPVEQETSFECDRTGCSAVRSHPRCLVVARCELGYYFGCGCSDFGERHLDVVATDILSVPWRPVCADRGCQPALFPRAAKRRHRPPDSLVHQIDWIAFSH